MPVNANRGIKPAAPPEKYMNRDEAAAYLNVSPRTLSDWQAKRIIPYIKIRGCVRFKKLDLDAAMGRLTIQAIS